jgi:MscS family membrane protein
MNRQVVLIAAFIAVALSAAARDSFGQTPGANQPARSGASAAQPSTPAPAQPPADPRESEPVPEPPPSPPASQAAPTTTEPASQPTTESAEPQDPRLTPRTMMAEFLRAVGESEEKPERIQDAVRCLDLSEMARDNPQAAERRGPVIARQLDEIIEALINFYGKTRWEIPRRPTGNRVVFPAKGEIQLVMTRSDDGIWRFSPETITAIPKFRDTIKQKKEAKEKESPKAEAAPGVPAEFRSARVTMRTFMDAMAKGDKAAAAKCLDLSDFSEPTAGEAGAKLVDQLLFVMDRIAAVVYQDIPVQPDAGPFAWYVGDRGRIELARQESGSRKGEWLFSKATVNSIEPMFKAFQDKPRVRTGAGTTIWNNPRLWLMEKLPSRLKQEFFGVQSWQWLGLAILIALGYLIYRLVLLALCRIALAMARKGWVDSLPAGLVGSLRPLAGLVMVATWWGGLQLLLIPTDVLEYVWPALKFILTAVAVWASYRLIDLTTGLITALAARTPARLDDVLVPLARKTAKILVVAVGFLFILRAVGAEKQTIQNLLAGLGIGGLAFALAAQESLKNFFGSITVVLDRPFQVGDWVKIGGVEGTVESVGLRSSRIRTFYDSQVTVPNSDLITATIDNMGRRRYRRTNCKLSVVYSTSPRQLEAFCEGIRELIRRHPHTRKDGYNVWVAEFAQSSIDILLDCFHEIPDGVSEPQERHRLLLDIIRLAALLNVEFAYPTRTVYLTAAEGMPGERPAPVRPSAPPPGERPTSIKPVNAAAGEVDLGDPIAWGRAIAADIASETRRQAQSIPPSFEPSQVD